MIPPSDAAGGGRLRIADDTCRGEDRRPDVAGQTDAGGRPLAAGSTTDIIPRVVFEQLSARLGQSIVVENRVGAGGAVGSAFVAKADPDGYTILAHGFGALPSRPRSIPEPGLRSGARFCRP